jgi:hypothetical protein
MYIIDHLDFLRSVAVYDQVYDYMIQFLQYVKCCHVDTILSSGIARVYAYVTIAIRVYDDVTEIVMRIAKFLCRIAEIPVAQRENQSHWEIFWFAPKFRVPPPNPITRCYFARIARPISIARYMRRNLTSR